MMSETEKGVRGRNTFDIVFMDNPALNFLLTTKVCFKKNLQPSLLKTRSASIRADKSVQNFSIFISFN
jgi:hypothetical protein